MSGERKRDARWLIVAALFVVVAAAYFGAYRLSIRTSQPWVRAVTPGRPVFIVRWREPIYLEGRPPWVRETAKVFFVLAHEADKAIRPGYWHTRYWTPE